MKYSFGLPVEMIAFINIYIQYCISVRFYEYMHKKKTSVNTKILLCRLCLGNQPHELHLNIC